MPILVNKETGHRLQCDFDKRWDSDETFLLTVSGRDTPPVQCEFRAFDAENLLRSMLADRYRSLPEMEYTANNPVAVADVVDGVSLRVLAEAQVVASVFLSDKQRRELIVLLGGKPPAAVRQGCSPEADEAS